MVVSARIETNSGIIDNQIAFLQALPEFIEEDLLDVAVTIVEPRLNDIAATAPPRGSNEFIWSANPAANRRAQRWWFANIRRGNIPTDGRHYIRQGQPPYGLRVDVDTDSDGVFMAIRSTWSKFNMVFGNILSGRGQLPGHRTTGWNKGANLINDVFFDANAEMISRHNKRVEAQGKRSTFGRPRRRRR